MILYRALLQELIQIEPRRLSRHYVFTICLRLESPLYIQADTRSEVDRFANHLTSNGQVHEVHRMVESERYIPMLVRADHDKGSENVRRARWHMYYGLIEQEDEDLRRRI